MGFQQNDKQFIANVKCSVFRHFKMFIINGKFMMRKKMKQKKPHIHITRGGRKCKCTKHQTFNIIYWASTVETEKLRFTAQPIDIRLSFRSKTASNKNMIYISSQRLSINLVFLLFYVCSPIFLKIRLIRNERKIVASWFVHHSNHLIY